MDQQAHFSLIAALIIVVSVFGCSEDAVDARAQAFEDTIARINALTGQDPAFSAQLVDDGRVRAAVPKGWEHDEFERFYPPGQTDVFTRTDYSVGTTCDGGCEPKDWAASFEQNHVSRLDPASIVAQETLADPAGKLVITRTDAQATVIVGRWQENAPTYFFCRATLRNAEIRLEEAFKIACKEAQILSLSNITFNSRHP